MEAELSARRSPACSPTRPRICRPGWSSAGARGRRRAGREQTRPGIPRTADRRPVRGGQAGGRRHRRGSDGGIEPTKELLEVALRNGASVITANKALLSEHGAGLHEIAFQNGVDLFYEAAVAGAIPLLRPLRESLAGDRVQRVLGIVNGTTNYILTKMDEEGADYDEVLAEAQRLGYAEADPTADVEGHDAAAKAAILATLAFHSSVTLSDVHCEGHQFWVTLRDVEAARDLGFVIKLLAVAERTSDSGIVTGCTWPWCRGHTCWPVSATRSTRCSWKRNPPAR